MHGASFVHHPGLTAESLKFVLHGFSSGFFGQSVVTGYESADPHCLVL